MILGSLAGIMLAAAMPLPCPRLPPSCLPFVAFPREPSWPRLARARAYVSMRKTKTPDPNRKQACAEGDKHVKKCELRINHAQTQTQTHRERETDRQTHAPTPHTHTHHTHTLFCSGERTKLAVRHSLTALLPTSPKFRACDCNSSKLALKETKTKPNLLQRLLLLQPGEAARDSARLCVCVCVCVRARVRV